MVRINIWKIHAFLTTCPSIMLVKGFYVKKSHLSQVLCQNARAPSVLGVVLVNSSLFVLNIPTLPTPSQ
jgi:hypothetical protein